VGIPLSEHPLFEGVDLRQLDLVLPRIRVQEVEKGIVLGGPGMGRPHVVLVLDGVLCSYDLMDDGGRVLYDLVEPGGLEGVLGVLGMTPHFIEALAPSRVATLESSLLLELVERGGRLPLNLVRLLTLRISRRERQLQAVTTKDPSRRIARQLLALAGVVRGAEGGRTALRLRLTHQQIADMLGIRRETVTIHLHALAAAGAVEMDGGRMLVSPARLEEIASGVQPVAPSSLQHPIQASSG
jgi:CRP-like cAMP-binding protein